MFQNLITIILDLNPATERDFFLTYIVPLIGPAIVVFTFSMNYKKDRKNKIKEAKRAWYFKAYFEPNLEQVKLFFASNSTLMKEVADEFNQKIIDTNFNRFEFEALSLAKFSSSKRRFLIDVVEFMKESYPQEAEKIEIILNDFEDACSRVFAHNECAISEDIFYGYISEITGQKARLIKTLSRPALLLKKNKTTITSSNEFDRDMV